MIKRGSKVKIIYTGKTEGKEFDSNVGKEPLEFVVGTKQVIEGFESAVIGLKVGDKTDTTIEPSKGYGEVREDLIMEVPKDNVPNDVKVGQMLTASNEEGNDFNVFINEIKKDTVILDGNHPLSGKELEFSIEILEVN